MKKLFVLGALLLALAFFKADKLTGRWESKNPETGNVTGVVFKADNTFEGYVNRKPFVSGTYTLQDDIFMFADNGCNGYNGTYKVKFFSNGDSLRFELMSDSCTERARGMQRLNLGRVK